MRSLSLTRQLVILLGLLILAAVFLITASGYWLVHLELDQQAISRLNDAQRYTETFLQLEQTRLDSTVALAAERPTLQQLVAIGDSAELQAYLTTFRQNTLIDLLAVTDSSGRLLAGDQADEGGLFLRSRHAVADVGMVEGVVVLGDQLLTRLAARTDLTYHFLPADEATPETAQRVGGSNPSYQIRLDLRSIGVEAPGLIQIDLPLSGVLASEQESLALLLLAAGLIAAGTALIGGYFVRSRLQPLRQLTVSAQRMGAGDLDTPISLEPLALEVETLARTLEHTRVELRRSVEALLVARQWSEALIQSVVEGIITSNDQGLIVFFSAGAAEITGWRVGAALGQPLDTVLELVDGKAAFSQAIPVGGGRRTLVVRHFSGGSITLAVTRAHQIDAKQMTLVIRDVTEETRRRKAQTYFLANMSHEFRTPLAGMQASVELLLENLRQLSLDDMQQLLNSLHLSLSLLHQLIDNLLESSKMEANHFTLNRRVVELEPLIGTAIRVVEPMILRRGQRLTVQLPLLPPPLKLDPTRIGQVIVNLLANASKYSPVDSLIDLVVERQDATLRISIADHGRGIAPDQEGGIFDPFVRLEPEQTDHGSGLGLAVVKAITEAHEGRVGVEARPGGGSVFWFCLPLSDPPSEAPAS
jgi:signal transduction histidine kinase